MLWLFSRCLIVFKDVLPVFHVTLSFDSVRALTSSGFLSIFTILAICGIFTYFELDCRPFIEQFIGIILRKYFQKQLNLFRESKKLHFDTFCSTKTLILWKIRFSKVHIFPYFTDFDPFFWFLPPSKKTPFFRKMRK